jgi:hypothetical protein
MTRTEFMTLYRLTDAGIDASSTWSPIEALTGVDLIELNRLQEYWGREAADKIWSMVQRALEARQAA